MGETCLPPPPPCLSLLHILPNTSTAHSHPIPEHMFLKVLHFHNPLLPKALYQISIFCVNRHCALKLQLSLAWQGINYVFCLFLPLNGVFI